MILVERPAADLAEILASNRPIGFVPAANRDRAVEVAIAVRDAGFGVVVVEEGSGQLIVLVVGDVGGEGHVRNFVARIGGEIAASRRIEIARAFVPASWATGMAAAKGADVGQVL